MTSPTGAATTRSVPGPPGKARPPGSPKPSGTGPASPDDGNPSPGSPSSRGPSPGPPSSEEPAAPKVVPARHYWRWVAGVAALVVVAQFIHGLVTNPGWDWDTFFLYLSTDTVLKAVWVTLQLTVYGTALGFALGIVLAFMRLCRSVILQTVAWTYIWAFRSIPLIVQLLFWFNLAYLYKELAFGIPFGPVLCSFDTMNLVGALIAAVLGLALHQAAYAAEIIRGGIISVDAGQLEAAAALGIPRLRQLRRIVLPQAMRAHPAQRRQRGHLPLQGHLDRLRDGDRRAVLPGAGDLRPQRPGRTAADGRHRLVHPADHPAVDRSSTTWSGTSRAGRDARSRRRRSSGSATSPAGCGPLPPPEVSHDEHRLRSRPRARPRSSAGAPDGRCAGRAQELRRARSAARASTWRSAPARSPSSSARPAPGKSTLLRTINHLEKVNRGYVSIDGELIGYRRSGASCTSCSEREVLKQRTAHRVRLPELQSLPASHRAGEHRRGAGLGAAHGPVRPRSTQAERAAGAGGARRQGGRVSAAALRRPAAARGHRPRAGPASRRCCSSTSPRPRWTPSWSARSSMSSRTWPVPAPP